MDFQIKMSGIEEFVVQKLDEQLRVVLDALRNRIEVQTCFVNKSQAIEILGTAMFLKAGEKEGRLTPIALGGSAGILYSVQQLRELSEYILQSAKSGSLPDHYFIATRNRGAQSNSDEEKVHHDTLGRRRQRNIGEDQGHVFASGGESPKGRKRG